MLCLQHHDAILILINRNNARPLLPFQTHKNRIHKLDSPSWTHSTLHRWCHVCPLPPLPSPLHPTKSTIPFRSQQLPPTICTPITMPPNTTCFPHLHTHLRPTICMPKELHEGRMGTRYEKVPQSPDTTDDSDANKQMKGMCKSKFFHYAIICINFNCHIIHRRSACASPATCNQVTLQ